MNDTDQKKALENKVAEAEQSCRIFKQQRDDLASKLMDAEGRQSIMHATIQDQQRKIEALEAAANEPKKRGPKPNAAHGVE